MRQNGIVTDGQAATTTLSPTDQLVMVETPGAINRIKKTTVAALRGSAVTTLTTDTTITYASHSGQVLLLNKTGASLTVTMPAATGSGALYRFVVGAVNTSSYIFNAASGELFKGTIGTYSASDGQTAPHLWSHTGTTPCDQVTLNGTTTGGQQIGDWVEFQDIATDTWVVRGVTHASGSEATPFTHNPSSSPSSSVSGTPSSSVSASASSTPSTSISGSASSSPSASISNSPSASVSGSISNSPSASISGSPTTSPSSSVSSSPSASVSGSPTTSPSSSVSSSPSSSPSSSVSGSPTTSPSSSPS